MTWIISTAVKLMLKKVSCLSHGDESSREQVTQLLLKLGYPESGTAEGLKAARAKAKSFVSCAVGRINS